MRSSRRYRHGGAPESTGGQRRCTRSGCPEPAIATLTYVYASSTAVVGPLAVQPEPHAYDLCGAHARGLTAPRGWELVRQDGELTPPPPPPDDLAALAEAVWDRSPAGAGLPPTAPPAGPGQRQSDPPRPRERGGHLRLIPPP